MTNSELRRGDVEAALDAVEHTYVSQIFDRPDGGAIVFAASDLKPHEIEPLNPVLPADVAQRETVIEPESFKAYLTAYKSSTAICRASLGRNQIEALLDYHGRAREGGSDAAKPGRCQHIAVLKCPFDLDYAKWRNAFGQPYKQVEFGQLLEDLVHTIHEPPLADVLEAVDTLRIDRQVKFKSGVNRRNGTVQFTYEEVEVEGHETPDPNGRVTLPETVKIVVPIFQGGPLIELEAKLRHRLDKGQVFFLFVVPGIDKIERDQFRRIGEEVSAATSTPVFYTE